MAAEMIFYNFIAMVYDRIHFPKLHTSTSGYCHWGLSLRVFKEAPPPGVQTTSLIQEVDREMIFLPFTTRVH